MVAARLVLGAILAAAAALPAPAQPSQEEMLRRLEALQREVDALKAALRAGAGAARQAGGPRPATGGRPARQVPSPPPAALATAPRPLQPPPFPTAPRQVADEGLRSDLEGLAVRIPGTDTSVRLYGFVEATAFGDLNARIRSEAVAVSEIPLTGSAADRQGGDFNFTARRSRFGLDTRTPTAWGDLDTRIEIDFAGNRPPSSDLATSSSYTTRLRLAYAEGGPPRFRVLVGHANSIWDDGIIETVNDSTNLNQSFVRQATLRVTGRLTPGLTGIAGIEAPYTDYTAASGAAFPDADLDGGASPAFNRVLDLLGRLVYQAGWGKASPRGVLRELRVNTNGTQAGQLAGADRVALGCGFAPQVALAMGSFVPALGPDRLYLMAYYGQGIGRYFDGNTPGQGAFSDLGLPGVGNCFSVDPVPSRGFLVGYRHFWTEQLRSTASYAYARQDILGYAAGFAPGSPARLALNREMQQAIVNLIWSPFAGISGRSFQPGLLDVGVEYVFWRRDLQGGAAAAGDAGVGHGIGHRLLGSALVRF